MPRGLFDFLKNDVSYVEATKNWHVELTYSMCFWYELIINPLNEFNTKEFIISYLKQQQKHSECELEKRFIYFLASRVKTRFCTSKKPRYSICSKKLVFYIEIGSKKEKKRLTTYILDAETGCIINPRVEISDRFITFHYTANHKKSLNIYDFLQLAGIEIGINTEVHYVGYTKSPSTRPISGSHRGLSDMLYRVPNEEHDFFIFYNQFKALSIGENKKSFIKFCIANSMINEIRADEEASIIEKALIKYFKTKTQHINMQNENSKLKNDLQHLSKKHKIESISINIEIENKTEMYKFFSRSVKPSHKHSFTCLIKNEALEIINN